MLALIAALSLPLAAPQVFFLEGAERGPCTAKARDVVSGTERALFTAPECPKAVLWSAARKKVVYAAKGRVFIRPLDDAKAAATDLGALPPGDLARIFITESGRNIRVATLHIVEEKDVVTKGDKMFFRFEGKELPTSDLPPWGAPYVAVLSELDGKGASKRIDARATRWEAGDTPGASVLDTGNPATDVVSLESLANAGTCVGGALACDVEDAAVTGLVGKAEDAMFGVLTVDKKKIAAFRVMFGDTPHAVPPLFLCERECASGKKLKTTADQLAITAKGGFLLVTEEYSGAQPAVFDATGKEVWRSKSATGAVWLP